MTRDLSRRLGGVDDLNRNAIEVLRRFSITGLVNRQTVLARKRKNRDCHVLPPVFPFMMSRMVWPLGGWGSIALRWAA